MKYINILPPQFNNWIQLLNYCNNQNYVNCEFGVFHMIIKDDIYEFDLVTIKANCFDSITKDLPNKNELIIFNNILTDSMYSMYGNLPKEILVTIQNIIKKLIDLQK